MILKNVEKKIKQIEGFQVDFMQGGRDVKGNLEGIPPYTFDVAAKGTYTAKEWIELRFKKLYPGYDARITDHRGVVVTSMQTTLATIRGK